MHTACLVFHRILAALSISLLVCACESGPDRADLVMINGAEPELLDPAMCTAQATSRVMYALYEGLTAYDRTGVAEPGVAERWEISPDGLIYTFHLRHDAKWSNGDPVIARHFAYSWQRTLTPATAAEYGYQLYYIRGARDFAEGRTKDFSGVGIRVIDDRTLEVTLENPTPFFLDLCAFATLLPVHPGNVGTHSDWSSNPAHFVANGAFVLKDWRLFDRVRVVKNPHYWNSDSVGMQSIDILSASRPNTAFNFYATGIADLMLDKSLTPTALIQDLRKRDDFHAAPFLGNYFFRFNCDPKRTLAGRPNPFADVRVRRAFSLAVDKKLITDKITRAGEEPAFSFTPPGIGGDYTAPPGYARDIDKAKQLMADAGFPGGRGFPRFNYLYRGDSDLDQDIAVELQSTFSNVLGVPMELIKQEWTVYLQSQSNLNYDVSRSTWVGDYNDPNTFLDMFVTGGGNNRTGWSSPRYDELIAAAAREIDKQKRFDLFREAERILVSEEMPICPLYYYVGIQFYDGDKLGGIESNLLDEHPLKAFFWKKR